MLLPVKRLQELRRIGDQVVCCNWGGCSQCNDDEPKQWGLFPWEAYKVFRANTPTPPGFIGLIEAWLLTMRAVLTDLPGNGRRANSPVSMRLAAY